MPFKHNKFQPSYYSYGIEGPHQQRLLCADSPLALKVGFVWSIPYRTKPTQIQQCGFPLGADPPVGGVGEDLLVDLLTAYWQ